MKWLGILISIIVLTVLGPSVTFAADLPVVRIGIVLDGPWSRYTEVIDLFKREIIELSESEFDIRFPAEYTLDGRWTVSGINNAIDELLSSPNIDLVIAFGIAASDEMAQRKSFAKPVIAPFVLDAGVQKLPQKEGVSGVKNLNYIDTLTNIERNIRTFRDVTPFEKLTVVIDTLYLRAVPEVRERARTFEKETGIKIELLPAETSVQEIFEQLPLTAEAVLLMPLLRIMPDDFQELVRGLTERRIPSYSYWGRKEVELGILASVTHESYLDHLARATAVNIHEILRGEDAGTLSVTFSILDQLTINMATARAIDIYPSLSILTEADLLNEERKDIQRRLTLEKAVQEALAANLDLAAADRSVAAGAEAVNESRSVLLPQLGIGSEAVTIDDDRARASGGQIPERAWTGSATVSQLIYSEEAWSGYTVQKHLQDSRTENRETLRLDIIQSAATTYLNVLRAKTIERIQKDNLRLTRANLERARVRESIGIAGPEEVYRWESQIAGSRQAVLEAESSTLNAMNDLNRILNRPIQEPFVAQEADLNDPLLAVSNRLYYNLVNNPKKFPAFRGFMVQEGLETSPELRRLDAEIAARERTVVAAQRAFWLPTFSMQGYVTELLADGGEGQRDDALIDRDDTDWSVGIFATFPLFSGGQKKATLNRTREELSSLQLARDAESERVEERILNAINITRASYPSIGLSSDAADAADKNLKLVTDSYERGIKSIIDLIDAQSQALSSDLRAANAVYNFLVDLMNVQRAVGRFDFFLSEEDRQDWFNRFEIFSRNK